MPNRPATTLHRIEAFLAAAKCLDWNKANQFIADPRHADRRRAYQLTRELVFDLFGSTEPTLLERVPASERGPEGYTLRLTPLGEEVKERALAVEIALSELRRFSGSQESVRVACFPAHVRSIVADVMSRSDYTIRIEEADDIDRVDGGARLFAGLWSGHYDIVMAPTGEHAGLEAEVVAHWQMEVVFPKGHSKSHGAGAVTPEDLRGESLLLSPLGHASRTLVESAFAESMVPLTLLHAGRSTEGLLGLVEAGLGVAILPSDAIWPGHWSTREFSGRTSRGTHSIYWKSERGESAAVRSVLSLFREIAASRVP
jgi:DNA-binding transcriptional LysR family regulator